MSKKFVIVAGSREFSDKDFLYESLDALFDSKINDYKDSEIVIVSGMARGADSLAVEYAKDRGYRVKEMKANWNKLGKSAGFKRNVDMARVADALVVFWDGESKGTAHMIKIMNDKNKPIIGFF